MTVDEIVRDLAQSGWFDQTGLLISFGSTLIGLFIGFHAYRGFRRHDSRPLQYLSIGLLLLTAVTYTISFGGTLLVRIDVLAVWVVQPIEWITRLTTFLGLAFIAYSLHKRGEG